MSNAHAVAQQLKSDPTALALLKERNPDLANILLSGDMAQFAAQLERIKFVFTLFMDIVNSCIVLINLKILFIKNGS